MTYLVNYWQTISATVAIEAESEDEARRIFDENGPDEAGTDTGWTDITGEGIVSVELDTEVTA